MSLAKNNILIIGAESDIALACAHQFASKGYDITLVGRRLEKLQLIQRDLITRYQTDVKVFEFDLLEPSSWQEILNDSTQVDVAISAVGLLGEQKDAMADFEVAKNIIETNFTYLTGFLEQIANKMKVQQTGTIVGISSVAGERGRGSNYYYGSAKAGFTAFLSGLRNEYFKYNVHVITVKPGYVDTKMTKHLEFPKLLTASPNDVANKIFQAVYKRRNTVYCLPIWYLIMVILKSIPEIFFKRMKL